MPTPKTTTPATSPVATLVDELGALEKELSLYKGKLDRIDLLRKSIREYYASSPADEAFTPEGEHFIALLGAKASEAHVSIPKLAKIIGVKSLYAIVSCSLKALEAFPGAAAQVVTRTLTGTRSLKVVEKGKP